MKVFVSGGCKNGKSGFAEKIAYNLSKESDHLIYIATMVASDDEDEVRIERHRNDRKDFNFITVERPRNIQNTIDMKRRNSTYLLDSTTALLANEMFGSNGEINLNAGLKVEKELGDVLDWAKNIVVVSDYIYSDAIIYDEYSEKYKEELARVDKYVAKHSDIVIEVSFGNVIVHKGKELLEGIFGGSWIEYI